MTTKEVKKVEAFLKGRLELMCICAVSLRSYQGAWRNTPQKGRNDGFSAVIALPGEGKSRSENRAALPDRFPRSSTAPRATAPRVASKVSRFCRVFLNLLF